MQSLKCSKVDLKKMIKNIKILATIEQMQAVRAVKQNQIMLSKT